MILGPFVDMNDVYFGYAYTVIKTRCVSCIMTFILNEDLMDVHCYSKRGGWLPGGSL